MGVVHLATDRVFGRRVAVKVLKDGSPARGPSARRFVDEARITGQLQHPGIPPVYHVGELPDGRPFLAMKLIQGDTLDALLKARGAGAARWLAAFEGVCQAVGYAHAHGVIHRDLKPQNVMVGAFGEVQVMDWGLAKVLADRGGEAGGAQTSDPSASDPTGVQPFAASDRLTRTGSVIGTPAFMAPEQAVGAVDRIDRRTDVFGLGGILCALLTGRPPYTAADAESTRQLAALGQLADAFGRLDACGADPDLVALCKRCLSVEPADRPADAGEVAAAVAGLRTAADERARRAEIDREKAQVESREQRKRRRVVQWAGAATAAVLLAGIGGTTAGLMQAWAAQESEARRADGERKARVQEAEQRAEAVAARNELWDGLDVLTGLRTSDYLSAQATVSAEQRKFLTEVLPLYRKLLAKTGDDEGTRVRAAHAAFRVGWIEVRLGRRAEGEVALRAARDAMSGLVADFPASPDYRGQLAVVQTNLGNLLQDQGQWPAAEAEWRASKALLTVLTAEFPAVTDFRDRLAVVHNNLGAMHAALGDWAAAEVEHRTAVRLFEGCVADSPTNPGYRVGAAGSYSNLGMLLADTGRPAEAAERHQAAMRLRQALADEFPAAAAHRLALAECHGHLGVVCYGTPAAEEHHNRAIAILTKLVADFPADPKYRSTLADAHNNLAMALAKVRKRVGAENEHGTALGISRQLVADFQMVPGYRGQLATSHINLSALLNDLNRRPEAIEQGRLAVVILTALAIDFPAVVKYRHMLAGGHQNLGIILAADGQRTAAEEQFRTALRVRATLLGGTTAVAEYGSRQADTLACLGDLLARAGRQTEAEEQHQAAVRLREELANRPTALTGDRVELGKSCCEYGQVLSAGGKPADSLRWFDRAVQTLTAESDRARLPLRNSHLGRARAYDRLGRHDDAVREWDRVITLSTPEDGKMAGRAARTASLLSAGRTADAVAAANALWQLPIWNPDQWYDFAAVFAGASVTDKQKQSEYAGRAVEGLRKAVAAGFSDPSRLRADRRFDPVRDVADFRTLLAELEKKFPPKAEVPPRLGR
jgi:tetratricopeptide (TPR) repeat protein